MRSIASGVAPGFRGSLRKRDLYKNKLSMAAGIEGQLVRLSATFAVRGLASSRNADRRLAPVRVLMRFLL
jgi:hypothetical protein